MAASYNIINERGGSARTWCRGGLWVWVCGVAVLAAANARATELLVPGQFATIQAAIDVAVAGDEVVIADGTYAGAGNKNLDFGGKAITVRSASGEPDACIIDCQGEGRGFYFYNGEGPDAMISGLTITNGYVTANDLGGPYGGGILCESADPTIANCVFNGNSANDDVHRSDGGAISCYVASPTITDCVFLENSANGRGGALALSFSDARVSGCVFTDNSAGMDGGATSCYVGRMRIEGSSFARNSSGYNGGGVCCSSATPVIRQCSFSANTAAIGGAVSCFYGNAMILHCTIQQNSASAGAGGIDCATCSPIIAHCAISGNSGPRGGGISCAAAASPAILQCTISANRAELGGGVYCYDGGNPAIRQCTLVGNVADYGGGLFCTFRSDPIIANCTICRNMGYQEGDGIYCGDYCLSSEPHLMNTVLWGNWPNEIYHFVSDPVLTHCLVSGGYGGVGNVSGYPMFVRDPNDGGDGWGDNPGTPAVDEGANDDIGDLRLRAGSGCIDAGNNVAVGPDTLDLDGDGDKVELMPLDFLGGPRFVDDPGTSDCQWAPGTCGEAPIVDMGAYEFVPACRGDTNCDGRIDFYDINPFVAALLQEVYCDGSGANADVNADGAIDFFDINPFVILLTQNPLPVECPQE